MAINTPHSGFRNSILICVDCGEEFVFTASAQQYFAERGFTEPPKRCKSCYNEFRNRETVQPEEQEADLQGDSLPPPAPDTKPSGSEEHP